MHGASRPASACSLGASQPTLRGDEAAGISDGTAAISDGAAQTWTLQPLCPDSPLEQEFSCSVSHEERTQKCSSLLWSVMQGPMPYYSSSCKPRSQKNGWKRQTCQTPPKKPHFYVPGFYFNCRFISLLCVMREILPSAGQLTQSHISIRCLLKTATLLCYYIGIKDYLHLHHLPTNVPLSPHKWWSFFPLWTDTPTTLAPWHVEGLPLWEAAVRFMSKKQQLSSTAEL